MIYADDTTLFSVLEAFGNDKEELEGYINNALGMINLWFKSNKLSINGNKAKAMLFQSAQRKPQ